jgi:hypothetical protein
MHDYSLDEQHAMLQCGIAALEQAGVPRQEVTAFRAGGYGANNETWRAMARAGLRLSSSYNLAYLNGASGVCRIMWPNEEAALFQADSGIHELPITAFRTPGGYRPLQVSAVSFAEMRDALWQARALGLPEVCVITHTFEFFYIDAIRERLGRPNRLNQRRFESLCEFLARHSKDFEVETIRDLARRLPIERRRGHLPLPRGKGALRMRRLVEQGFKRIEAHLLTRLGDRA